MKKSVLSLVLLLFSFVGLTACTNDKEDETVGTFYDLQKAYDDELLTVEELQSIAHYQSAGDDEPDIVPIPKTPENLSDETVKAIKETYLVGLRTTYPKATLNDVNFLGYYGTYNGAVAIKISDGYSGYPGVVKELTVAGVTFTYSGAVVTIWKANLKNVKKYGGIIL